VRITRYPGAGQGREFEGIQPWEFSRDRAVAEPGGMRDRVTRARRGSRGRLWPDARQTLLLRAGLLPAPAAIEAWQRIGPGLDVSTLDRGSTRLLPLVWSHLQRHGVDVDHLAEHYRSTRAANERLLEQLGELLPPLHREGIPTILLKGPALVVSAYPDVGVRPMSDVDVLVPIERVADATRTLQERGWVPQSPLTAVGMRLTHSLLFKHPQRVPVDLHWHVFEECCRPGDDDGLWAASVPVTIGTASTRVPAPEDQLLHVCVHGEKWVHVPGIRWIADAVTIIRHGRVHWERLVAEAVRRRFVLRISAQLDYLRSAFDPPIPPEVMTMLAAAPVSRLERFEWRWGVRDQRRPWLLVFWCNHVRSAPGGLATTVLTFPQYLQATWHLESLAQVPGAAAARVLREARRRLRPRQA
jgi:Uncharacterised nucleotidyltransferase